MLCHRVFILHHNHALTFQYESSVKSKRWVERRVRVGDIYAGLMTPVQFATNCSKISLLKLAVVIYHATAREIHLHNCLILLYADSLPAPVVLRTTVGVHVQVSASAAELLLGCHSRETEGGILQQLSTFLITECRM